MDANRIVRPLCLIALNIGVGILSLATLTRADTTTGLLYVADYGKSELDRYQYTYDTAAHQITGVTPYGIGNNLVNAYFLGGGSNPIKEGVHGTSTDLIVVGGSHGSASTVITRYTLGGSIIGTIPVDFSAYNGGNVGIGNVLVTQDGKYMYAPLESAGYVVKIDLVNGNIVANYQLTGAHDVAIAANGDVYAADYNGGPRKVVHLDSNLAFLNNLITSVPGTVNGGTFRPSGLSVAADGSLYVQNNTSGGGTDSVLHYTFTGSGAGLTATLDAAGSYLGSAGNNALEFTFGNNIGPDGNLYIAALGGGGGAFGTRPGFVDGVYRFDTTSTLVSQFIAGYTETGGPNGPSGLQAPKYLQFGINFSPSPDAGYNIVPEPSTITLWALCLGVLGYVWQRRVPRALPE